MTFLKTLKSQIRMEDGPEISAISCPKEMMNFLFLKERERIFPFFGKLPIETWFSIDNLKRSV